MRLPRRSARATPPAVCDAAVEEPGLIEADSRGHRASRSRSTAPSSVLMVEPRIAARRAQVEAEASAGGGRRRRWAVGAILIVLLLTGAALALLSPLARARTVVVVGAERSSPATVRAASGLSSAPPLLRVDTDEVTARLADLPWVRRATVERRWPGTVVVTVEERTPVAVTPCQAGECLVDGDGRLLGLAPQNDGAAALPRLAGVPVAGVPGTQVPDEARGALAVATALPSALRPLVLGVRGEGGEVSLDLHAPGRASSPPVVRLGTAERIPDKLTAAATVLARTSVNGVAVLDVRVPESPALTRVRR